MSSELYGGQDPIALGVDDELEVARLGFTQSIRPADLRHYAGQLRAKAAAHRAEADRLDATTDALYRFLARHEGGGAR